MNELDIIESLRQKEDELDNLLKEARQQAFKIKEDAICRSEEIKLSVSKEIDAMLENYKKQEVEKIEKEAEAIKAEAEKQAEELRLRAKGRQERTVEIVVHYLIEG